MKILHIHDAGPLSSQTNVVLQSMIVTVDNALTADEAGEVLAINSYDLAIWDLDANSPDTGNTPPKVLPHLRSVAPEMQILVCGSNDSLPLVTAAIQNGAHDFILRPMRPDELRLRVLQIAARPSAATAVANPTSEYGPLVIDIARGDVVLDGRPIEVTPRERSVLQVLVRANGRLASKDQIASSIFTLDEETDPKSIETYIHRLRKKTKHPDLAIETVRGLGYRLTTSGH